MTKQPQEPISAIGAPAPPVPVPQDLRDPALYANRELSWLAFNQRVLELAEDPDHRHDLIDPRWAALSALTEQTSTPTEKRT